MNRLPLIGVAFVFLVAIPWLEIGPTHLFHPGWPGHARLHEAWQLGSNASLALVCLWLGYRRGAVLEASVVALAAVAPFLVAAALNPLYGGSFSHVDGEPTPTVAYAAVPIMAGLTVALLAAVVRRRNP